MPERASASTSGADCASVRYSTAMSENDRLAAPLPARPESTEKKLCPPISPSIVCTTNSASARSVGAAWIVMRSCIARTIDSAPFARSQHLRGCRHDRAAGAVVALQPHFGRRVVAPQPLEA